MDNQTPQIEKPAFTCPHCNVCSQQIWQLGLAVSCEPYEYYKDDYSVSVCTNCEDIMLWKNEKICHPIPDRTAPPNSHMPDDIQDDYNEARDIIERSPRSACMLLRLCIEKICNDQGLGGKNLYEKIQELKRRGHNSTMIKALDSVRIVGGQAAHPLEMNLKDDKNIAKELLEIVNYIADQIYRKKDKIDKIHDGLPENKKIR